MPCGGHEPICGRASGEIAGGSTGGGSDTGSAAANGASGSAPTKHSDADDSWISTCTRARVASVSNSSDVSGTGEVAGGCGDGQTIGDGRCSWVSSVARPPVPTNCAGHMTGGGECGGGCICGEPSPGGTEGVRHACSLELPAHDASSLSARFRRRSMDCTWMRRAASSKPCDTAAPSRTKGCRGCEPTSSSGTFGASQRASSRSRGQLE